MDAYKGCDQRTFLAPRICVCCLPTDKIGVGLFDLPDVPSAPVADRLPGPEVAILAEPSCEARRLPDVDRVARVDPIMLQHRDVDSRVFALKAPARASWKEHRRAVIRSQHDVHTG